MPTTEDGTSAGGAVESPDAAAPAVAPLLGGNELVADSFGEYLRAQWQRIRGGESGVLPVVIGLIIIVIVFQTKNSKFLSHGNLTNLIEQSGVYVMLGMAEVFVLLLGEIDLSTGFVAGIGAAIAGELATDPHNINWLLAILVGLGVCAVWGVLQGLLFTRLGLPSFVVTLAGQLAANGLLLYILERDKYATGGSINVTSKKINDVVNGSMSNSTGWIVTIVAVALFAAMTLQQHHKRRGSGLVTPPLALTLIKIGAIAIGGVILVLICNANRGLNGTHLSGMPWIVVVLIGFLTVYTVLLNRTRFGRYVYAIGGNAEAARRAGINVKRIQLLCFILCSLTAGVAGVIYLSFDGGVGADIPGGTFVLYAIAAAVIGGTSLFGGRGKMIHAVLGGIVVTTIYNGMGLIQIGTAGQDMVIGLVLLAAVTVDALSRRGRIGR
jgi:D-xylose transport system permease protein